MIVKHNEIIDISIKLKAVILTANYLCRLVFTSSVFAASNERVFSVLKLIKSDLRTTMSAFEQLTYTQHY
jgi:hypothetical protein